MRKMKEAYKFMTDYTMYTPAYDTKAAQAIWEIIVVVVVYGHNLIWSKSRL